MPHGKIWTKSKAFTQYHCLPVTLTLTLSKIFLLSGLLATSAVAQTLTSVVFQGDSTAFPNPDRGFYTDVDFPNFTNVRAAGQTLTRPYIRLDAYRNSPLPQSFLNQIAAGLQEVRRAGIKIILRFSYNFAQGDPDATPTQILLHLQQLAPILAANEDVISLVEAGFIGAWGEWHHSTNGSDSPTAESAVVNGLMSAVPPSRMVAIRYPADLRRLQATGPITPAEAFTGTLRARLGSHQDCFLASPDDWGTWGVYYDWTTQTWKSSAYSIAEDKAYIAQNAAYAPVGGETCNVNPPRTDCPSALSELAYLRWSYLNLDYEPTVVQGFKNGGCFAEINRRLGYRFQLTNGSYSGAVAQGGSLQLDLRLMNQGYAAMFNARPVFAVLRNGSGRYIFSLNEDPRTWAPGLAQNLSATLTLPTDIPPGTYTLALWLPDQALSLRDNPHYAVRFANLGVWDAIEGDNVISNNVTIQGESVASVTITPSSVVGGSNAVLNQVTLTGPAPAGGALVTLAASDPAAAVPASVSIAPGAISSAVFIITTTPVGVSTPVTISAAYNGSSQSGTLTVNPPSSKTPSPSVIIRQQESETPRGTAQARPAARRVAARSNSAATVPPTAASVAGANRLAPLMASNMNLSASPALITLTAVSATVIGGTAVNITVTLNGPAPPDGAVVAMTTSNGTATIPPSIQVPQGALTAVVPVTAGYVTASTPATISASYGGVTRSVTLTVMPPE